MQHEFLPVFETSFKIAAMKKTDVHLSRGISHRDVKYRAAAALEADRGTATSCDFRENRVDVPGSDFGNGRKSQAIFIAEGKVAEQIGNRQDAALFKRGGALRTDSAQVFNRIR